MKLNIETIDFCNMACSFCKNGVFDTNKNVIFVKDYEKIFNNIDIKVDTIDLTSSRGEIFLHPNFLEILDFTLKKYPVQITTSFNKKGIVPYLKKFQEKYNLKISVSKYGSSLEEFLEITNASEELYHNFCYNMEEAEKYNLEINILDRGRNFKKMLDAKNTENIKKKGVCSSILEPKILINGNVSFCFINDYPIGNIFKDKLSSIIKSGKYKNILRNQMTNKYIEECENCDLFNSVNMTNEIFKDIIKWIK
jgi:radical SAM protein with 4Fe4S-binding SPASM domain